MVSKPVIVFSIECKTDTEMFLTNALILNHTNGKKKSTGNLASIVGGTLNPGLADADTSTKLTEVVTDSRPPALVSRA